MFSWFLPKEAGYFDFFEQHALKIKEAAREFLHFVDQEFIQDANVKNITAIEHDADQIAHHCIESLHKTFITPFEREDIFKLISQMDDVIDLIEEAAREIETYHLREMTFEIKDLAQILFNAVIEIEKAIHGLRNLKNAPILKDSFNAVHHYENEADTVLRKALGRLFDEEKDAKLIIKWKGVYENIENAIDRCQDIANTIEGVILDYG